MRDPSQSASPSAYVWCDTCQTGTLRDASTGACGCGGGGMAKDTLTRHGAKFVRTVRAHEGETVEIQWTLRDGRIYIARQDLPPQATIEARLAESSDPPSVVGSS